MTSTITTVSVPATIARINAERQRLIDESLAALRTEGFVPRQAGDASVFVDLDTSANPDSNRPAITLTVPEGDYVSQLIDAMYLVADVASGYDFEEGYGVLDTAHKAFQQFYNDHLDNNEVARLWATMTMLRALDSGDAADWAEELTTLLGLPDAESQEWDTIEWTD